VVLIFKLWVNTYKIKNKKILSIGEGNKVNLIIKAKGESVKNKLTKNEIRIFKKFAEELCPYLINPTSIKKKDPPEPDISCSLSDGSILAFELVEIIDEDLARSRYDSLRLEEAFKDELKKQPQKRKQFELNFNNAVTTVIFNKKISFRRKKNSVPIIIDYLLTLDKTAEGKFSPKGLNKVLIDRGKFKVQPKIEVDRSAWINDPSKKNILKKFKKNYKINSRTELLAYYEVQPKLLENYQLIDKVKKPIIEHIKESVFQRVWIYSVIENEILFIYPNL